MPTSGAGGRFRPVGSPVGIGSYPPLPTSRCTVRTVPVADVTIHRPTLDDVFLALTGHAADDADTEEHAA